ncbi:MAG: hypothetical protein KJN62_00445 [Deltaproteobacteria bacterium]|nr:hypothetical protein [Deltaproteobacteria bacterium]
MKLNLKKLDCKDCKCNDVWFKENESARCISCKSRNFVGSSYSFYIDISLEDGLYLIVTQHGQDDNTSYPTEDRIYTLQFNGRRSGDVSQEIKDMAEKVMVDYVKNNSDLFAKVSGLIKKAI